ncbi:MAG: uroporphyrinogen-III synthase [Candidatus Melainabacteria bacterium]|nr:uroporphyrinogen-III synthase [Candidatus Melainabacteria bacterium]
MTIVITRPLEYLNETKSLLEAKGLDYFNLPCLEFTEPSDDYHSLDKVIRANHEYDWLIFLSKRAAQVFFDRLLELGGHLFNLSPRLKIACVGEQVASFVRDELGFPVDFVPSKFNSKQFLQEFEPDPMSRVILVRNELVRDDFEEQLSPRVLSLELAKAYSTKIPELDLTEFDKLLASGEELILSFASSDTVKNFSILLGAERITKLNAQALSIGPRTSETIRELLPSIKVIEAEYASLESMLDAIMAVDGKT